MIIRQDRLGREKERGNDKRAGAAGARAEEADRLKKCLDFGARTGVRTSSSSPDANSNSRALALIQLRRRSIMKYLKHSLAINSHQAVDSPGSPPDVHSNEC